MSCIDIVIRLFGHAPPRIVPVFALHPPHHSLCLSLQKSTHSSRLLWMLITPCTARTLTTWHLTSAHHSCNSCNSCNSSSLRVATMSTTAISRVDSQVGVHTDAGSGATAVAVCFSMQCLQWCSTGIVCTFIEVVLSMPHHD